MNNFQQMALFFCTGIISVQLLTALPSAYFLVVTCIFALCVFRWVSGLSFMLLGFVMAVSYSKSIEGNQLAKSLESQEILIIGRIIDLPTQDARSIRFLFNVDEVITPIKNLAFPTKIRLSWYDRGMQVRSGEKWQLLVKLKRPHGLLNPYGVDYEKWLFQQSIGATGYVRKSNDNKRMADAAPWSMGYWRESLKEYLEQELDVNQHVGVIKALVLGDRSSISAHEWEVFRKTGTSHLIAISGLHIGLVSALFFGVVRWLLLRVPCLTRNATRYAIMMSILAAILYAALAGFSVPTQRALIMLSVVLGGIFWQRHYTPFHVISMALVTVLIYDPLASMSAGFWLSFGAVSVILYSGAGRIKRVSVVKQLLLTQWWVSIGLMPLVMYFFQQVSVVGPLANLLAIPFVSFAIIPLLIIALLLALIDHSVSVKVLDLSAFLIDLLWQMLESLSVLEFSSLMVPSVSLFACAIGMVGVILLLMPKGLIPKPLACLLFLPLFFSPQTDELSLGEFKLVLLDVGQGLSAVIHTAGNTLVFDTGAKYSEKSDLASSVIIPYLNGKGIKGVNQLIVSHGDNDHAGGAQTLLSGLPVDRLFSSVPGLFSQYKPLRCEEGISWRLNEVLFEFLSPSKDQLFEGNNASCVLKVSSVNGSVLLTGDIEKSTERSLLQYQREKLKVDVLIAPHHGSSSSSTVAFIKAVDPSYVLFPVGYKNRFGFPKEEVVERYKKQGALRFDTANNGAITVLFYDESLPIVKSFREEVSKFWNWRP